MKAFEQLDIDISIAPEAPFALDADIIQQITETLLTREAVEAPRVECHVKTCSLEDMQQLNADTRQKDKPTNVLSFAYPQAPQGKVLFLGDIVLCPEVIEQEAQTQNKTLAQHSTHLLVHGLLHLLGYDHEDIDDAAIMEQKEIDLLAKLGHPNPYEEHQG